MNGKATVVIVGHGPGLFNKGKGKIIDGFETVVRMGRGCEFQDIESYGEKTDYYMLPSSQFHRLPLLVGRFKPTKELWLSYNMTKEAKAPVGAWREELAEQYKEYNPTFLVRAIRSWHRYLYKYTPRNWTFSTGMTSIINTVHRLRPKSIALPGFDNLLAGTNVKYRSGGKRIRMNHNLGAECKLLNDIQYMYDVRIDNEKFRAKTKV